MADIICIECKTTVSDASGYCPECGYPFDSALPDQNNGVTSEVNMELQETIDTPQLDIVLRSMKAVSADMKELQMTVDAIKQELDSRAIASTDNTQSILAEITRKLDAITSASSAKSSDIQKDSSEKTKKELLATFYKTLNSPNSMFEYMFYISVVQIVFVIVNLFLVTYIVTLVK